MPIRTAIWRVAAQPEQLAESSLAKESLLETMIVAAPRLLSDEWMLIGRQEDTGFGGRIDLLAVAPDGSLVLIELKRDRTPREVVAQALDYAGWVERLQTEEIAAIYSRFAPGHSLAEDFRLRFGQDLDEETLNQSHQIIIVAASLDDSTERIVGYLSERDIPINVLCFQIFTFGTEQLLSRAWLLDPVRTQVSAAATPAGPSAPWNGEFYCFFGHGESRSWDDAVKYGFQAWCTRTGQGARGRLLDHDWERLVTFSAVPKAPWKPRRPTNVVESPFAAVRLRPAAATRFKKVANATAVIWTTLLVAERSVRRLDAPELLADVAEGVVDVNGERVKRTHNEADERAAA